MPLAAVAAIAVGGSIAGGAIAGHSASKAASTQAAAAEQAAELQHQDAQAALDWQKQVFGMQTGLEMPWINAGRNSLSTLSQLMGLPGGGGQTINGQNVPFNPNAPGWAQDPSQWSFNTNAALGSSPTQFNRMAALRGRIMNPDDITGAPTGGPRGGFSGSPMMSFMGNPDAGNFGAGNANGALGPDANLATPSDTGLPGNPGAPVQMNGQPATATATAPAPGDPNAYLQPFTNWTEKFQAPTDITMQNDPGYLARLKMGQTALENSAAARGTLLTGGTAKDLTQFGQDYASNEFNNVYNRALTEYQQRYNIFNQQQATQFNRLAALAGYGQTGVGQLSSAGTSAANNAGNILLTSGGQIGQDINNIGAARASGYVGAGNAYGGMFNNLSNLAMMYGLFKPGSAAGTNPLDPGMPND